MKKKNLKRLYFSLVELMVVITIIGLLGGIVAINVFGHVKTAKIEATRASINAYSNAVDLYYMDTGKYPSTLNDLFTKPEGIKGWKGPYTRKEIQDDAWHNPYVLTVNASDKTKPYQIYSYGPDGAEGNDDIYESEGTEGGTGTTTGNAPLAPKDSEPVGEKP